MERFSFDGDYLDRLRRGDPATEEHFVRYFNELILIKLRSRLVPRDSISDIRQETFARVFAALRSESGIHHPERLGAFVNSVCQNVLMEWYRSAGRYKELDETSTDIPDKTIDLDGALVSGEARQQVSEVLAQLSEKDRSVLRAIFVEERDKDEICRQFGVDRDYLRVVVHRAKNRFRLLSRKGGVAARHAW